MGSKPTASRDQGFEDQEAEKTAQWQTVSHDLTTESSVWLEVGDREVKGSSGVTASCCAGNKAQIKDEEKE